MQLSHHTYQSSRYMVCRHLNIVLNHLILIITLLKIIYGMLPLNGFNTCSSKLCKNRICILSIRTSLFPFSSISVLLCCGMKIPNTYPDLYLNSNRTCLRCIPSDQYMTDFKSFAHCLNKQIITTKMIIKNCK